MYDKREEVKSRQEWDEEKAKWTETKLKWLEAPTSPELVADTAKRLDAVLEFTIFVDREVLLRNYNVEKHDSDVYDQFQLHYLAVDRFVIVTEDGSLRERTARSSQAARIVSFDQFFQTLKRSSSHLIPDRPRPVPINLLEDDAGFADCVGDGNVYCPRRALTVVEFA